VGKGDRHQSLAICISHTFSTIKLSNTIMTNIQEIAHEIGLPVNVLQNRLPLDEDHIARLIEFGFNREQAEEMAFLSDLMKVRGLMVTNDCSVVAAFNAVRTRRDPDDTTEEEEEDSSTDTC
jgi:hypothetical protein